MNKWFRRAVGTAGIAGGVLLLGAGTANADDAALMPGTLDDLSVPAGGSGALGSLPLTAQLPTVDRAASGEVPVLADTLDRGLPTRGNLTPVGGLPTVPLDRSLPLAEALPGYQARHAAAHQATSPGQATTGARPSQGAHGHGSPTQNGPEALPLVGGLPMASGLPVLAGLTRGGLPGLPAAGNQAGGGSPLGGSPLGGSPLGGSPLGGSPLGGSPLGGSPLGGGLPLVG